MAGDRDRLWANDRSLLCGPGFELHHPTVAVEAPASGALGSMIGWPRVRVITQDVARALAVPE
jgi:hypothetical protein